MEVRRKWRSNYEYYLASDSEHVTSVGDFTSDRSGCDHERAHEHRTAGRTTLAALEVTIRRTRAKLIADQLIRIHRQAHGATG